MRRILTSGIFILVLCSVYCISCKKEAEVNDAPEQEEPGIIVIPNEADLTPTLPQEGGETTIQFTAKTAWSAAVSDTRAASDWLSVSPTAGSAGDVTLTLTAQTNDSTDDREGYIKIYSGTSVATIAVTQKQRDALTVTPSKYALDALESEFEIKVQANVQFVVEIRADWIEQIATRAMTTTVLAFKAKKNIEGKERTGTIIIRSGEKSETITVTQEKGDFIVDTEKFNINAEAQTISAKVRANTDFEVTSKADWIHYNATRAMTSYTLDFDVDENETGEERTGEITVAIDGKTETITVIQSADVFVVDVSQKEFKFDGGTFSVSVKSDIEYRIEIPDDVDWITEIATRAITTTMHNFRVAENTLSTSRSATLKIYYQSGDMEKTHDIKITQERATLFSDLNQYEIDARAQKVNIKVTGETWVTSYIEYYIIKGVEWISRIDTRAVTVDFTFSVDENTTGATREGEIEFTLPDKTTITVRIVQSGEVEDIPDENFRAYCIKNYDKNGDGIFTKYEASLITSLNVSGEDIKSLEGIEYFTALTYLNCSSNQLTSLDVSKNTALTELRCYSNQLTSLDVSGCQSLNTIYWYDNPFEYINLGEAKPTKYDGAYDYPYFYNVVLGASPKLKVISSKITKLGIQVCRHLDVSECPALTELVCSSSGLTSLDVSKNTKLTSLDCHSNQLTSLDVSGCTALTELVCSSNQLTALDVSKNTKLTYLDCRENQLTALDVSKNTKLTYLDCRKNQLTSLDLSKNTKLKTLHCEDSQLTALDISGCTALENIYWYSNPFEYVNLGEANPTRWYYYSYSDGYESYPYLSRRYNVGLGATSKLKIISSKITKLDVSYGKLQSLDVSECPALTELHCESNRLTSLDVSGCQSLTYIYSYGNPFEYINLGEVEPTIWYYDYDSDFSYTYHAGYPRLLLGASTKLKVISSKITKLDVSQNKLQSLDVSECPALTELSCYSNKLTSLDVSKNTKLKTLRCENNQLTSLDVSGCTALTSLSCYSNQLTSLDVSKTNLGNSTSTYPLDCSSMKTLETLYLKTGWLIYGITKNRSTSYIPSQTQIVYVD